MEPIYFYGHELMPSGLTWDVFLALFAPLLAFVLLQIHRSQRKWNPLSAYIAWCTILILPNAAYLFMEGRHLLIGKLAVERPLPAIIGYSAISLFGLACAVLAILIARQMPELIAHPTVSAIALSFLSALGTAFGLKGLASSAGLLPFLLLQPLFSILADANFIYLIAGLTVFLSVLSITIGVVMQKYAGKKFFAWIHT